MRVALIEPSHWHFAMYRDGLVGHDVRIVGVTDQSERIANSIAADYGCKAWSDISSMLEQTRPDFAFAFGAHSHMPSIASELIARGIPFSIEKPCGLSAHDVANVRRMAEAVGVFVSIPFHYRISGMAMSLAALMPLPSDGFVGMAFRINAGSPQRYKESSPWLVDPAMAGGGCMMNLAHHAVDFIHHLTGAEVVDVSAHSSNKLLGLEIEDHAVMTLSLSDGSVANVETGYTHVVSPESYLDFDLSLSHRRLCVKRDGDALSVRDRASGHTSSLPTDWVFKTCFAHYAQRTLALAAEDEPPIAGLVDLERTMRVIDAAYASLSQRAVVKL